jgi:pimeloyl-ACP methyl ester carboxylesterase
VHHDLIIRALQSVDLTALTSRKGAEDELARLIDGNDTLQFLLKNLYREKQEDGSLRFAWRFNLDVIADEIQEVGIPQPWRCDVPTLFIRGSRSDYIRKSDFTEIEKLYPRARFVTLDTGHWVHAEDPEGVTGALKAFIE